MAWHVGHSLETLLTTHSLPLPGGPFPQVFPAAVVHLGESSALKQSILTDESLHIGGKINRYPEKWQRVLVLLSILWVCPTLGSPLVSWEHNTALCDSAAPGIMGVEGLWKLQGGSKHHEGKAYLLQRQNRNPWLVLLLFLLKQNLKPSERILYVIDAAWSWGDSFAISEEIIEGMWRSCLGSFLIQS